MLHTEKQSIEGTYIYTWLETKAGRGVIECASAVLDFLKHIDEKLFAEGSEKKVLRLFSDACSSQNKNSVMISVIAMFLQSCRSFTEVIHYFPVRGHSYMPLDRVFGQIEKTLRKKDTVLFSVHTSITYF